MDRADHGRLLPLVRIGGICGPTSQAVREATLLAGLGYHAGLLSLAALGDASDDELIAHCRRVAEIVPLIGFYLQPAVGGRPLGYAFWRRFAEIDSVVAIKIAPFNRYQTLDVIRAVVDAGRDDIALYTGNDDQIVGDLVTPYPLRTRMAPRSSAASSAACWGTGPCGPSVPSRCWRSATLRRATVVSPPLCCARASRSPTATRRCSTPPTASLAASPASTRCCGGRACWPARARLAGETLGPARPTKWIASADAYPHLLDDEFVAEHLETWLRP